MSQMDVVIIGGGASGFFCACELLIQNKNLKVAIWEKTSKTLGKVRISGGGRCNVTHDAREVRKLLRKYPRGSKYLRAKFNNFGVQQTIDWFENRGVKLKTETDFRMFPITDSSETVAKCLENTFYNLGGITAFNRSLESARFSNDEWHLVSNSGEEFTARYIVLAIGGLTQPKANWLNSQFSMKTTPLVPSIFTLNIKDSGLHELSGLSVSEGRIKYEGFKQDYEGPVLITHWGLSGPAVLASSAWHAVDMYHLNYHTIVQVGWIAEKNEDIVREELNVHLELNKFKKVGNSAAFDLPKRLWNWILSNAGIDLEKIGGDLKKDERNRLVENVIRTKLQVSGRTTYKEEFVTAGGVDLEELNPDGSFKKQPKLFAIGEMLDIDGITGGFNFQAAWSTAFSAAHGILKSY